MTDNPDRLGRLGRYQIEYVAPATLTPHPENARRRETVLDLEDSIRGNDFFEPIIAQRATRQIISGNHTWRAAKRLKMDVVPVIFHDIDADHARRILAVANKSADHGGYDAEALEALLGQFDGNYYATGYTREEVDALTGEDSTYDPDAPVKKEEYTRRVTDCPDCGHTFIPNTYKRQDLLPE